MKNELLKLYEKNKSTICDVKSRCKADMKGPFLISPNDSYCSSDVKVAFVGQETHGWPSSENYPEQMQEYLNFNLGEKYYPSPFWNVIRKLEKSLVGNEFSSVFLNLNRFDQEGSSPSYENKKILSELDFILIEELKIISPHVVIFFTGPSYDERLFAILGSDTKGVVGNFDSRKLCMLNSNFLPATTKLCRTYHPLYLRRSGLEKDIINAIEKEFSSIHRPLVLH